MPGFSTLSFERMAHAVLRALRIEPAAALADLVPTSLPSRKEQRAENLEWARTHLAPWVKRRVQGTSSGDGIAPKHAALTRLAPREQRVDA